MNIMMNKDDIFYLNSDYVLYSEALLLKELKFNEPCLWFYADNGDDGFVAFLSNEEGYKNSDFKLNEVSAPTFQQAFRFFRKKYKLDSFIHSYGAKDSLPEIVRNDGIYTPIITSETGIITWMRTNDYEEAQLCLLKKLIEIVKNK